MKRLRNQYFLFPAAIAVLVALSLLGVNAAIAQNDAVRTLRLYQEPAKGPGEANNIQSWWGVQRSSDPRSVADFQRQDQTLKLLSDYSQSEDEKQRAKILDDLTKVVSEHFDVRREVREREAKDLEEQVRKLRELQQRRAKEKDQIVRDRVRQLLRDVDGLGWGDEGSPSRDHRRRAGLIDHLARRYSTLALASAPSSRSLAKFADADVQSETARQVINAFRLRNNMNRRTAALWSRSAHESACGPQSEICAPHA